MAIASGEVTSTLTAVVLTRRGQFGVRFGLTVLTATVFHGLSGIAIAAGWVVIYALLQAIETALFRDVSEDRPLTPRRAWFAAGLIAFNNVVFASFGIALAIVGGTWGVLAAALVWSGAILNGTMVSGGSLRAFAVSILPPTLAFATIPSFVMRNGGTLAEGLAILAGGLLNTIAAFAIWTTARRLLEAAVRAREAARAATLDPETGLPNRFALERRIEDLRRPSSGSRTVVAAISINRFEQLQGAIGHARSAALVSAVAERLGAIHPDATLARISARVLAMAWTTRAPAHADEIAQRLRAAMRAPLPLGEHMIDVSVTIGVAGTSAGLHGEAAEISNIDQAMIAVAQARQARQPVAWFDPGVYGHPARNLSLMSEMLRALDNGQMTVHYQPKYALESREIVGVEALLRWFHPERGAIAPDAFLPMAEETGHIEALTLWVIRRAMDDQHALAAKGHDITMAVNLSGRLIDDADFTAAVLQLCSGSACKLIFEVTETAIIGNPSIARQTLEAFRAAGIAISIDDYGSGFSSLAYLKNIPADELKIDKSFVIPMGGSHTDFMLVRSAIELGHSLGLRVVAEGVETQGVLDMLARLRCDVAQGFLIARPMPAGDLAGFIEARRGDAPETPGDRTTVEREVA